MTMTWIAGVDGFRRGWRVVLCHIDSDTWLMRDLATFRDLLALHEEPTIVCVDMPVGLPEYTQPGGRACEIEARRLLGPRRSSVFSVVGRIALACDSRGKAHVASVAAGGIGVGAQAWGLSTKLREIDSSMTAERQRVVFEVHPELCFWALNSQQPMAHGKKTSAGRSDRIAALSRNRVPQVFLEQTVARLRSGHDDFLDACAAAWTARRIFIGAAERLPRTVERDNRGLDMAIWF
jgi:predicted RNase H-like nuclease